MNRELTLSDGQGGRIPNFSGFGLKFKAAQKLAEELDRLWARQREAGREAQELAEKIRQLENELPGARARAVRDEGEAAYVKDLTTAVDKAKGKLEVAQQRVKDLRVAAEMAREELRRVVAESKDDFLPELEDQIARDHAEIEALIAEVNRRQHGLEARAALLEWLEEPAKSFAVSPAPHGALA